MKTSRFIHGVLQNVFQSSYQLDDLPPLERLSIETSHPLWLVKMLNKQYGDKETKRICHAFLEVPRHCARVNTLLISREELLNQVWGYDFVGETRTLDVHINSLRKKLGPIGRNYIKSVRQLGYRFSTGDSNA